MPDERGEEQFARGHVVLARAPHNPTGDRAIPVPYNDHVGLDFVPVLLAFVVAKRRAVGPEVAEEKRVTRTRAEYEVPFAQYLAFGVGAEPVAVPGFENRASLRRHLS